MEVEWFELLPEQCPPEDAQQCDPKFRNANIALVELKPKDGMIKKTFGTAHYSWWRTKDFDVSQAKVI